MSLDHLSNIQVQTEGSFFVSVFRSMDRRRLGWVHRINQDEARLGEFQVMFRPVDRCHVVLRLSKSLFLFLCRKLLDFSLASPPPQPKAITAMNGRTGVFFFAAAPWFGPNRLEGTGKAWTSRNAQRDCSRTVSKKNHIRENTFLCWPQYNAQWESCLSISVMSSNYLLWRTKSLQEALQPLVWLISTFRISDWINNSSVCLINALIDSLV